MAKIYKYLFLHLPLCFYVLDIFCGEDIVEESKRSSRVVKKA